MQLHSFGFARCLAAASVLAVGACTTEMASPADYTVAVGQQLNITLRTIGPGAYDATPAISSPIVHFITMVVVQPYNPGGPIQQFSFEAQARGRATITFHRSESTAVASYTVEVQ